MTNQLIPPAWYDYITAWWYTHAISDVISDTGIPHLHDISLMQM